MLFSDGVKAKARQYVDGGHVLIDAEAEHVYWVTGSTARPYRVQTDAWPGGKVTLLTCTCKHGAYQTVGPAACSHAVAVLLAVRDCVELSTYGNRP